MSAIYVYLLNKIVVFVTGFSYSHYKDVEKVIGYKNNDNNSYRLCVSIAKRIVCN